MSPMFRWCVRATVAIVVCALGSIGLVACSDDGGSNDTATAAIPTGVATPPAGRTPASGATATGGAPTAVATEPAVAEAAIIVTSEAFVEGGTIPVTFTCSGDNTSPELSWSGVPEGTQSFALLVDDPDAPSGNFDHWVVFDLPANAGSLPANIPEGIDIAGGGKQGVNGTGTNKYLGPCPPAGTPHRYQFRLFALDAMLEIDTGSNKAAVEEALQPHILARGELVGMYGR